MKILVGVLLTMWVGSMALADARAPVGGVVTGNERATETLKQLERDWAAAEQAGDSDKIGRIVADDWSGVSDGRRLTKTQLLEHVKSSKHETVSVEFGPMDVKILGDVAVVQGSDVETGTSTSGQEIWMDVFANRDGRWVAVRSQSTMAGTVSRPRWPI
jgi:ketosteroid isomerase-like protein